MKSQGKIKEIKCTCNQCKNVWHYLESDKASLNSQAVSNALIGFGMCCNPFGAIFSNKSIELNRQLEKFKKCPKCGSEDIAKKEIYYERKA